MQQLWANLINMLKLLWERIQGKASTLEHKAKQKTE